MPLVAWNVSWFHLLQQWQAGVGTACHQGVLRPSCTAGSTYAAVTLRDLWTNIFRKRLARGVDSNTVENERFQGSRVSRSTSTVGASCWQPEVYGCMLDTYNLHSGY